MGAEGSKAKATAPSPQPVVVDKRVTDLQSNLQLKQKELDEKRGRVTELEEKVKSLEGEIAELKDSGAGANEQKKEWQLQAASTQSRLEKYRDRFESLLEKQKAEADSKLRSEVALEVGKMEIVWRDQLKREKDIRMQYERLLLANGFNPGQMAGSLFPQVANLSMKESELRSLQNSTNASILPVVGQNQPVQFYSLNPSTKPRASITPRKSMTSSGPPVASTLPVSSDPPVASNLPVTSDQA